MDNKCPKCGTKLRVFYLKPDCPKCGCNIMNYNYEARLEADADKAEAEWAKVDQLLAKFKRKKKKEDKNNENPA